MIMSPFSLFTLSNFSSPKTIPGKCLFMAALTVVSIGLSPLEAMDPALAPAQETDLFDSDLLSRLSIEDDQDQKFTTISEMIQNLQLLSGISSGGDLLPEIINDIALIFFYLHTLPKISMCLEENRDNPKEFLDLLNYLHKAYGEELSVNVLRIALENSGMVIGDIRDALQRNCIQVACIGSKNIDYLPCIKIIFCLEGAKAWDLISSFMYNKDQPGGCMSAWHNTVLFRQDDLVSMFIKWAVDNGKIADLIFSTTREGFTALHLAIAFGRVGPLPMILEQAKKLNMLMILIMKKDILNNKKALDYFRDDCPENCREAIRTILHQYLSKPAYQ